MSRQIGVGACEQAVLTLHDILQFVFLVLGQVGSVGHPDRPVLKGVNGFLVGHRLLVKASVLPHGVMISPYRRGLLIADRIVGVIMAQVIEALNACWLGCFLA